MRDSTGSAELRRIRRISDTLCTGHAALVERYAGRALIMDLVVLIASAWVVSLSFVDPDLSKYLTPPGATPTVWIGLMGLGAFVLTLVQMRLDLKGRADAHKRAFEAYAEVKRDAGRLLSEGSPINPEAESRVLSRYDFASSLGIGIPEGDFLKQKRRHLIKVKLSRHLDQHPSATLWWVRLCWWVTDSFRASKGDGSEPSGAGSSAADTRSTPSSTPSGSEPLSAADTSTIT